MKQSFVDILPAQGEATGDHAAEYFARVAVRTAAEIGTDANAAIVQRAQEELRPLFMAEIITPQQNVYTHFKDVLQEQPANLQFTQSGPSVFWLFQRRSAIASGRDHIIQTCVEVTAPYETLDEYVAADVPAAQRVVAYGAQPDHDIFGVHRNPRLGMGKLFGFKPYEPTTLAASMADQLLKNEAAQVSIYTAVDHGEGLQPQVLGRFRFNHTQHVQRKAQYFEPQAAGTLAQAILQNNHELSTSGAESYLRAHIGWELPGDYVHLQKVTQIIAESSAVVEHEQSIAPVFAFAPVA